jgi:hypothetical protein
MSERFITAAITILVAIIGVAILAVLVSKQSNTSGVITSGSGGIARALCVALSPITGGSCGSSSLIEDVQSKITFPGAGETNFPPSRRMF